MRLVKSHAIGNDYLVLASGEPLSPVAVRALCDRHRGPGADGVLEPVPSQVADSGLRIWNPDGSTAEKSGNGLRIFARWLVDHRGASPVLTVETEAGVVRCEVHPDGSVTVQMGRATLDPAEIPAAMPLRETPRRVDLPGGEGVELPLTAVGIGNPHCVVFVDGLLRADRDLDALPWRAWGVALETSPLFPRRANVQFAAVRARDHLAARVWERGAGETLGSGSSACAVAVAGFVLGRTEPTVQVEMPGGALRVRLTGELDVELTGPVEEVGEFGLRRSRP